MPQFDLPLAALHEYRSPTPEPADFDDFWHAQLAELGALSHDATFTEIQSVARELRVFDVRFAGEGGAPIRGWLIHPRAAATALPCIVTFLGYGGGRGLPVSWTAAPAAGFAQFVMDTRGQGSHFQAGGTGDPEGSAPHAAGFTTSGIRSPHHYFYRRVFLDACRAVEAAASHPAVDEANIFVAGESQGGAIALATAALSSRPRAVIAEVPFMSDIRRAIRLASEGPYLEIVRYAATHGDEALHTLDYFDGVAFSRRIRIPALVAVGLMDAVCPPSTVFAAFNELAGPRELRIYPYSGHEHGRETQLQERLVFATAMVGSSGAQ